MSNQKYKNKGQKANASSQKKSTSRKKSQNASKNQIAGFSTLNQVAGVPYIREYHSSIPLMPTKSVKEPGVICPICNQAIDTIASAISKSNGEYVHFDCALNEIKEAEKPTDKQVVSYIGSGNFGICEKDENGQWIIVKKINYESKENYNSFKEYIEGLKN